MGWDAETKWTLPSNCCFMSTGGVISKHVCIAILYYTMYLYKYSVAVCKPEAMYINASRIYFPDVMRRFSISASTERKLASASNAKTGNEN